jgi:hypothetical protein
MIPLSAVKQALTAGCGFLLAVLWFDLMHDTQLLRTDEGSALGVIRGYYRRSPWRPVR